MPRTARLTRRIGLVSALVASATLLASLVADTSLAADKPSAALDFNRDIRTILSNNCFQCHGPDGAARKADLRLDTPEGAFAVRDGAAPIVKGKPDESEFIRRITSKDPSEQMPPPKVGKHLTPQEIETLTTWVKQGAPYAQHWSYVKPVLPTLPDAQNKTWPRNAIDRFILARLEREGLAPSPEADRYALIRRLSLDLTGLPPTLAEVDRFAKDTDPQAYEKLVDRLLASQAYGEYWARMWLDLARYADSAGYADDPARTIWAYRDYVIRSFNANKPFDQFTIEQMAGDLLPNPTEDQLIATALHRNTLTNSEGGTNDEEFRNVAVVDRVNTTMSTWMGTTFTCCQCHDHKYDPLTQEEFFKVFAIFNNTEDADLRDESPLLPLYTQEQISNKAQWERDVKELSQTLETPTPELLASLAKWEQQLAADIAWTTPAPENFQAQSGAKGTIDADQSVLVAPPGKSDSYALELPLPAGKLAAVRLEALPHDSLPAKGPGHAGGNFMVTRVAAALLPPSGTRPTGRFVRIEISGPQKILSLAEVQVFNAADNVALKGMATQSSVDYDGPAKLAIDGNTDGKYELKSTTHTASSDNPWWEVDLQADQTVDRIVVWNRTDPSVGARLANFKVTLLDAQRMPVFEKMVVEAPNPSAEFAISAAKPITFSAAIADFAQAGYEAANVLNNKDPANKGWAIGGQVGQPHSLVLIPEAVTKIPAGSKLVVTIDQLAKLESHTLGRFRVSFTSDERAGEFARLPASILAIMKTPADTRSDAQKTELTRHYLTTTAPELKTVRDKLAATKKLLADLKPNTTVPIFRELTANRRKTNIQMRGNYLDLGPEVGPGLPAAFHPGPADASSINRLTLAKWLVDENNPLTARVIANRYWEQIFGVGIVLTSEEFGSQGELPSHPELLDWLAIELMQHKWDLKHLLKQLVMSAAYRQSSRVSPELMQRDPDNRLLARGPRFRLPAETIRDQALAVSGLLSPKMYGPPVRPMQPSMGVNAAFGSAIDWQTSMGEDQHRRAIYTLWRRSNPYPSMSTFDAPNREVCTVRRSRTNTPLQALVTLNDPVYIEAAQAVAKNMVAQKATPIETARFGFQVCLSRPPSDVELQRLVSLHTQAKEQFAKDAEKAKKLVAAAGATPAPSDPATDAVDLAAWTVVANVLLNLDETLMKR